MPSFYILFQTCVEVWEKLEIACLGARAQNIWFHQIDLTVKADIAAHVFYNDVATLSVDEVTWRDWSSVFPKI